MKHQYRFFLPLVFGLYCLVQGCGFAMSANPVIQLAGLGLWIWMPCCAHYAWRGYRALTSPVEPAAVEEQFQSEEVLT